VAVPEEEVEQMAVDYTAGLAVRAVAAKHGRPYGTTYYALQRAGVQMRPQGGSRPRGNTPNPDPAARRLLVADYTEDRLSLAKVAALRGYSKAVVGRVLREEGVQMRTWPGGRGRARAPAPPRELVARLVNGYTEGLSMKALARRHKLHYSKVNRILHRAGVQVRPVGRAVGGAGGRG
jgi:hypothetical protein